MYRFWMCRASASQSREAISNEQPPHTAHRPSLVKLVLIGNSPSPEQSPQTISVGVMVGKDCREIVSKTFSISIRPVSASSADRR